ncbi:tyrosine-type recombinase/integrase [Oryzomonas japonica]|uniref:Tyrosine-type recombinase/integrase n=1 Tax=Oryzomonas japonica TaxID=2603858 RepID=A0A7J4ZMF6_9BACT|nr:tyrosine-type recombinase/integrase [Oryzomonas japonica]KAB0663582.1 tyrosine-type recombinase/integrase [Oryzomonas japonica]
MGGLPGWIEECGEGHTTQAVCLIGFNGSMYINTMAHHLSHHNKPTYLGLPRWTPHDLRRTAATGLASIGCPDEIIDEIQNHKKKGIIRTYNRYRYDKEKQEWLTKWSAYLRGLISIATS